MIWRQPFNLEVLNSLGANCMPGALGIEFIEYGDDFLRARMPVDRRTTQPMGLLHGGASVVLAETLGSVASVLCLDDMQTHTAVGLEINANHLNSVSSGYVVGAVRPLKVGRRNHVWQVDIHDDRQRLICVSRLTIAVIENRATG